MSITRAVRDGKLKLSANGLIDAGGAKNRSYMQHQADRKARTASGRQESTLYSERVVEGRGRVKISDPGDELEGNNLDPVEWPGEGPPEPDLLKQPPAPKQGPAYDDSRSEIDYAIEKMRSATALNKARLAAMVKATIRKDFVDKVISLIGTSISDHLITLGDRLSPDLAALAGSTDASVVRRIKQALDEDVSAALHEMQRVVVNRYEQAMENEKC
jgi:hypothetical protein